MSLVTTFIVTLVLVSINVGYNELFMFIWMRSWLVAFVLVGLAILFLAPVIRNYLNRP